MTEQQRQLLKVEGALECLKQFLEHCQEHTIPVDEDTVWSYLQATQREHQRLWQEQQIQEQEEGG